MHYAKHVECVTKLVRHYEQGVIEDMQDRDSRASAEVRLTIRPARDRFVHLIQTTGPLPVHTCTSSKTKFDRTLRNNRHDDVYWTNDPY